MCQKFSHLQHVLKEEQYQQNNKTKYSVDITKLLLTIWVYQRLLSIVDE